MHLHSIALLLAGAIYYGCVPENFAADSPSPTLSGHDLTIGLQREKGELEIRFKDQQLLVYAFASNQFKPYVRQLSTLRGDPVLRDGPTDHRHHHGLMYAIRVNGVNFWEEVGQPGHERSLKFISHSTGRSPAGFPQATFVQSIHWIAAKDKTASDTASCALLMEQRTLTLTVDESDEEVALEWRSDFQVGGGASRVTLTGSEYNGLGMRLPEAFDRVARYQNSDGVRYTGVKDRNVIAARWSAASHPMNGREVMVALFAKPHETAGQTLFFTTLNPFAYLSVTQGLDRAPLEYKAGDNFGVIYLVLVYPNAKSKDFLEKRYRTWTAATALRSGASEALRR